MKTFAEFWPFYLREHSRPATRTLHFVGTTLSLLLLASAAALRSGRVVVLAIVAGYAFAWVGHFFVEHNKPATFKYPLWSLAADWKMWGLAIAGRLDQELNRAGVNPRAPACALGVRSPVDSTVSPPAPTPVPGGLRGPVEKK